MMEILIQWRRVPWQAGIRNPNTQIQSLISRRVDEVRNIYVEQSHLGGKPVSKRQ
jgi:hypothetical protein